MQKAAVDKEWHKLNNLPAWRESKVKSKKEDIEQAQKEGKTVRFATLMDSCHLKNSELEKVPNIQRQCSLTWRRSEGWLWLVQCLLSKDLPFHTRRSQSIGRYFQKPCCPRRNTVPAARARRCAAPPTYWTL